MEFQRYLAELSSACKTDKFGLFEGASLAEIEECEAKLGFKIPLKLQNIYKVNNGQSVDRVPVFPLGHEFLPMNDMASIWMQQKDVKADSPDFPWQPNWIPFAQSIGGGLFCYCYTDSSNQISQFYADSEDVRIFDCDIDEFLKKLASEIKSGKLVFDESLSILEWSEDKIWNKCGINRTPTSRINRTPTRISRY